ISEGMFSKCANLSSVSIPYGVTDIGMYAFEYCSQLESITLPSSVKTVGISAFNKCSKLSLINLEEDLRYANSHSWDGCDTAFNHLIENPATVKGKTAKVKYRKLRKKTRTVAASKVLTVKAPGQSAIYVKLSGKKKITINKYTGKVTVKKKLKRGTYKIKVKVMATGNATYKASGWKTVTFKIKVK
ncbi:MAG: leucine-rich repeat protein, partial [Clostridiales bacterium]|nr:leucine-rich repeat protein [Clostridiales bacterium]